MNTSLTILVTGATGATGSSTVRELLGRGVRVRAMVHKLDPRSEQLSSLGAEIVEGNLLDFDAVRSALEGIQRAYFVFPIVPGIIQAAGYFAQAANEVRLEAIVNMSQTSARRGARSHAARDHWIAERLRSVTESRLLTSGPHSSQNALPISPLALQRTGIWPCPFAQGNTLPSRPKIRDESSPLFCSTPLHIEARYIHCTEPRELSYAETADAMSEVLGRTIRYEQIDFEAFGQALLSSGRGVFLAQHLKEVAIDHTNGIFAGTNDLVEKITGQKPQTVRQFILKHKGVFALPSTQSAPS